MDATMDAASLQGLGHDDKWARLEPIIRHLYSQHTVKEIAKFMKEYYGFDAK